MSSADHIRSHRGRGGTNPVRAAAMIIYATFVLLILTIPQSLSNWLRDMNDNPAQQALLHVADAVQAASHSAGLDIAYIRARSGFFALLSKDDN